MLLLFLVLAYKGKQMILYHLSGLNTHVDIITIYADVSSTRHHALSSSTQHLVLVHLTLLCRVLCVLSQQSNILSEVMRKEMGNDIAALSIAPVPPGRRKSLYMVRALHVTSCDRPCVPECTRRGRQETNDTIPSFGAEHPC